MRKANRYIDIYFLLLIILVFSIITLIFITVEELQLSQYILIGLNFIMIVIAYFTNIVIGLITSAFLVFFYGSYILYESILYNNAFVENSYIWIIIFPLSTFISGKFGEYILQVQEKVINLEKQINDLVTIDEITGLNNMKEFIKDLEEEMSRSKRHKFGLVLMIIEIQYFEELINIYGRTKANTIMKIMANLIEKATRNEDKRYKVKEDMFAIIMPNTTLDGAEVVKNRLKKELENILIQGYKGEEKFKFDVKVGLLEYDNNINGALKFKEMAERELEFDV